MQKILMGLLIAAVLAGCSSTPTKEQDGARVEDRVPSAVPPAPPSARPADSGAASRPLDTGKVAVDPLKDPGSILSKRNIYFDYDSSIVKDEFKPMVAAHARYLGLNRSSVRMRIEGNTDERGSREYNLALGQRRADAVKQMMGLLGAAASQIETVSFGEEKPRAQGSDEKAWAENRRADIRYQGE